MTLSPTSNVTNPPKEALSGRPSSYRQSLKYSVREGRTQREMAKNRRLLRIFAHLDVIDTPQGCDKSYRALRLEWLITCRPMSIAPELLKSVSRMKLQHAPVGVAF